MSEDLIPIGRPTTFLQLVGILNEADELLASIEGVDLAELVGDLRDKVDALQFVDAKMEGAVAFFKEQIAPLQSRMRAITNERARLRDYVAKSMRGDFQPEESRQRFQKIPGVRSAVQLYDSAPALEVVRPPTAVDFAERPEMVEMQRSYVWKNAEVKAALLDGKELEFAKLTRGCFIKFTTNVPPQLETKKKAKK